MTQPTTPAPGEDSKGFWRNLILWALLALLLRWLVVELSLIHISEPTRP